MRLGHTFEILDDNFFGRAWLRPGQARRNLIDAVGPGVGQRREVGPLLGVRVRHAFSLVAIDDARAPGPLDRLRVLARGRPLHLCRCQKRRSSQPRHMHASLGRWPSLRDAPLATLQLPSHELFLSNPKQLATNQSFFYPIAITIFSAFTQFFFLSIYYYYYYFLLTLLVSCHLILPQRNNFLSFTVRCDDSRTRDKLHTRGAALHYFVLRSRVTITLFLIIQ